MTLREAGADAIDVADSPMAKMRMSAWAACRLIQERAGVETVLHFPTPRRNLLRLQGDLLGAHALGIRSLFVCVGDPVTVGDFPQALNDVDVTATGMLALVTSSFNEGVDRAGVVDRRADVVLRRRRVAPAAPDPAREARLALRKVEAGARFFLTQPLYGPEPLERFPGAFDRGDAAPSARRARARGDAAARLGAQRRVPAQRGARHRRSRAPACRDSQMRRGGRDRVAASGSRRPADSPRRSAGTASPAST